MPVRTTTKTALKGTAKRPKPKTARGTSKATTAIAPFDSVAPFSRTQEQGPAQEYQTEALDEISEDELSTLLQEMLDGAENEKGVERLIELHRLALGIFPTTPIEAMLALQIAELHRLALNEAERLRFQGPVKSAVHSAKILDTLIRAFASHTETLRKLRS